MGIFLNLGIKIPGIFIPGDWGFLEIWGFLSRGLGIFIPGDWGFLKSGDIYPRGLGIFGNLGIFIPGIFAKSRGYLRNPRDLYPHPRGFFGDFYPRDFLGMGIYFRGMGISHQKATFAEKGSNKKIAYEVFHHGFLSLGFGILNF